MRLFAALVLCAVLPPTTLAAQALPREELGTLVGLGVRSLPEYDGSSEQELELIPAVRYYGHTLFARTTQGTLEGGARFELVRGLFAGVQLAYVGGNDRTDVDPGAAIGAHLEWDTAVGPAPVNLLLRVGRQLDSDLGTQTDLRGTVGVYDRHGLLVGVFAQGTWAGDEWVSSYYTAGDGGLLYSALGVDAAYALSPHWVALLSTHLRRLHGDAATSPITDEETNYYASISLAYRF
jgi:outer membrane scaffolding protein for murein synthesis (MipA/OmpV family)